MGVKVFIPKRPDACVLKGACMIGRDRDKIKKRRSRFTYGLSLSVKIDEKKAHEYPRNRIERDQSGRYFVQNGLSYENRKKAKFCQQKIVV